MTTSITRRRSVFDAGLPTVEYQHLTDPDEAHHRIGEARRQSPIAIGPYGPEILRYDVVHDVLRDHRFIAPRGLGLKMQGITSGRLWDRAVGNILSLDGEPHTRLRRLVSKAFSPRSTVRLQMLIRQTIAGLADAVLSHGSGDIVTDIARPYPTPIICALLGAPSRDWGLIANWADDIMKVLAWNVANDEPAITAAWDELDSYLEQMVVQRRSALTDDLISELIRAEDDGERLDHDELLMLAAALLVAGTDTTRNQLAAAVHCLTDHPDQWRLLGAHPELAHDAVEEVMRYYPAVFGTMRAATEDVELAGVVIPAGTLVVVNTAAANRDPEVFGDPDILDITRRDRAPILTFGGGVHYCLGAHLARLELTEGLRLLPDQLATVRRTGPVRWKPIVGVTGPATLPVAV